MRRSGPCGAGDGVGEHHVPEPGAEVLRDDQAARATVPQQVAGRPGRPGVVLAVLQGPQRLELLDVVGDDRAGAGDLGARDRGVVDRQQRRVGGRVSLSEREVDRFIEQQGGNMSRDQARQALFQRKANDEMEDWVQEIRSDAFVDERLEPNA